MLCFSQGVKIALIHEVELLLEAVAQTSPNFLAHRWLDDWVLRAFEIDLVDLRRELHLMMILFILDLVM